MYNNRIKNIELPENLFSNLGELKSRKPNPEIQTLTQPQKDLSNHIIDKYKKPDQKLTNYTNKNEYRDRINKMYEDIKDIQPIDSEVDDVLYFDHYVEKGIVVKPKLSSLKQFWTEYRLINNEKTAPHLSDKTNIKKELADFDELFQALSIRVSEINKYIDELKEMRTSINISSNKLEEDKEKFSEEKNQFLNYKKEEESKLKEEKENLKINFQKLQTIIDDLDRKLESIDQ